jgi:hypothetical protein
LRCDELTAPLVIEDAKAALGPLGGFAQMGLIVGRLLILWKQKNG